MRIRRQRKKNQYKIGGGHIFDNGAGLLAGAFYDLGKDFDQFRSTFQEYEGWYPVDLGNGWTFTPGGLTDVTSDGTTLSPYAGLGYKINDIFNIATRYRYNHNTHKSRDNSGEMDYNDSHQVDIYFNYQATDKLWLQFNPEFFINTGDYYAANGNTTHWEPSIVARYRVSPTWMPYGEIAWLDKDQNNDNQVRFRIGVRYYL